MKKFENPTMDIEELKIIDVITTSGECDHTCNPEGDEFSLRRILG